MGTVVAAVIGSRLSLAQLLKKSCSDLPIMTDAEINTFKRKDALKGPMSLRGFSFPLTEGVKSASLTDMKRAFIEHELKRASDMEVCL